MSGLWRLWLSIRTSKPQKSMGWRECEGWGNWGGGKGGGGGSGGVEENIRNEPKGAFSSVFSLKAHGEALYRGVSITIPIKEAK